ncbi:ATP-dependent endonuclease [Achromobacter sp. UMC46]|uniref:ATP-dependent nuclease n=1 Tax=Achromobacter sp. UMC46 TaxID=1862319 RepID=UPI0016019C28|nr:AAA family ATPase [Achromobacter sp. UMC46]MBB1596300.1 ATP-dependent endonuclease [Achromobacter sp. UMC46]
MQILVETIRVAGFRGLKNIEITLQKVCLLIGLNNAGKTSLIKSLQLALGDYGRYLSDEDFHIPPQEKRMSEIRVDIRVISVDDAGKRQQKFSPEWIREFGDRIQSEATGHQFIAIRTIARANLIKGGFDVARSTLDQWPPFESWQTAKVKENRLTSRFQSLPLVSIDAQRDIQSDLKDRSSFVGKVLASVEYSEADITELEGLISNINSNAVEKSESLTRLKTHLSLLNEAIGGDGAAEITPFPKKIRDLSKNFSVHFGATAESTFSMEYHGMGTRSWASMLSIRAFLELLLKKHAEEQQPIHPLLAAEEPEAHLHPNAQRALYDQLCSSNGQLIISTHSPFLVAMADLYEIRSLSRTAGVISTHQVRHLIKPEEKKAVAREVMNRKGDLFFSRAIILCEGITEEQVLPAMFSLYWGKSHLSAGISCVSVGGKGYRPFVAMAASFGIRVYILSDNDGDTKEEITRQISNLRKDSELTLTEDHFAVGYMDESNDFEAELLSHGLREEIIESFVRLKVNGRDNEHYLAAQKREWNARTDPELLELMRNSKASYAGFLADVIYDNKDEKPTKDLIPASVLACFDTIKGWLQ